MAVMMACTHSWLVVPKLPPRRVHIVRTLSTSALNSSASTLGSYHFSGSAMVARRPARPGRSLDELVGAGVFQPLFADQAVPLRTQAVHFLQHPGEQRLRRSRADPGPRKLSQIAALAHDLRAHVLD